MPSSTKQSLISPFWLMAWASALSWCWLLPNHYLPWSTFHMDAWAATVFLPIAAAVLWRTRDATTLPVSCVVVLALSIMPWLQYVSGMIPIAGTAWISFAYLLGLAMTIHIGQRWELHSPAQLGDGLFMAIGIASVLSVGLQLHQWLQLDLMEIWSMGNGFGRPFANFGQPNQLATFLLWGVLALVWGTFRAKIRPVIMIAAITYLLFGIALTTSRTAWIGVVILAATALYWHALWPWRSAPWVIIGLVISFFGFIWVIPTITNSLLLSAKEGDLEAIVRMSAELRPQIWVLFLDSISHRPMAGYGWNQVASAQLAAAVDHPNLGTVFTHAHNLFLDFVLWCGIPVGLTIVGLFIAWFWRRFRAIDDVASALMFLLIMVVCNHAMLELPLHHAYFLLPTGLVIGALDTRLNGKMLILGHRWLSAILWLGSAVLLAVIVRDYARIEASYQILRFEWTNIRTNASRNPPDVLVLNQLRDLIAMSRFEPSANMTTEQLDWMRNVASLYPSAGVIHKLSTALVWNKQPDEAALWLRRLCAVAPQQQCNAIKNAWKMQSQTDLRVGAVPWPVESKLDSN